MYFQVNIMGQTLVIVNGYNLIKEVLNERGHEFSGRPKQFRIEQFSQNSGYGFSQPNQEWKTMRKATFKGIRTFGTSQPGANRILGNIMVETVQELGTASSGKPIDCEDLVYKGMLRSLLTYLIGEDIRCTEEVLALGAKLDDLAIDTLSPGGPGAELDVFPWLRHFKHPTWKKCQELNAIRDRLWELLSPMIKGEDSRADENSIAKLYWKAANEEKKVDEERVKLSVGDMMIAGTKTTTNTIYTFINILVHHPHVQKRLQEEIDQVIGRDNPHLEDLDTMPYMQATVLELNRYYSITPLGLPHTTIKDNTLLKGYHIPQDATILINMWGCHYNKEFWEDPECFRPERFLDEQGNILPPSSEFRRHVVAFGMGSRVCPGMHFSRGRIFLFMSNLLQSYNLVKDPNTENQPSCDPSTFGLGLALNPNKYKVVLETRKSALLQPLYQQVNNLYNSYCL